MEAFECRIAASRELASMRSELRRFLERERVSEDALADSVMACHEACAGTLEETPLARRVRVHAQVDADGVWIAVASRVTDLDRDEALPSRIAERRNLIAGLMDSASWIATAGQLVIVMSRQG